MNRGIILVVLVLLSCRVQTRSQSIVQNSIQLLTPDVVAEANLEKDEFFAWVKVFNDSVQTLFSRQSGNLDILTVVVLHPDRPAEISLHTRPKLDLERRQEILENLKSIRSPYTKFTDYSFLINCKINKGFEGEEDEPFSPKLEYPFEVRLEHFKSLDLSVQQNALRQYVQNEVLPIVQYYASGVDEQFIGVKWVGEMIKYKMHLYNDIDSLMSHSPEYWRACMEMSAGNQLIPFAKECMHIAKGEFDKAERLMFLVNLFSEEGSLPHAFSEQIAPRLETVVNGISAKIKEGLVLHDQGKYEEALQFYSELQREFSESSWLAYEIFYSKSANLDADESDKLWREMKPEIYAKDAMYPMDVRAKTGKEAYLLFKRQSIKELFKESEELENDVLKYADIALDLGVYHFAAQLYWMILTHLKPEQYANRNLLAHYLYCLDKLGDKVTVQNFEGNFQLEFDKIEMERSKMMIESPLYKAFKN